jgi:putative cell wall-binding protein
MKSTRTTILSVAISISTIGVLSPSPSVHAASIPVTVVGGTSAVSASVVTAVSNAGGAPLRIGGVNRYDTAAKVALDTHPGGASVVYVAAGTGFPDALAAAAAAGGRAAPVLLTQPTALPAETAAALRQLRPNRVIVVGSSSAVSETVVAAVRATGVATVTRLGGPDRYATAVEVSRDAFPGGAATVFVAAGVNFPDALAAAAAAAHRQGPILLSTPSSLPATVEAELRRLAPTRVVLAGGTAALSSAVESRIRQVLPGATVQRVGGANRYETASLVANEFSNPTGLYLASGTVFADALVAAAAAGHKGQPVLITSPTSLASQVAARLPRPPTSPGVDNRVVLPLLPPGKTAADYPQTTPAPLITAVRNDLLTIYPTLAAPPLGWDQVPGLLDPKPLPTWAAPDPSWQTRSCRAIRNAGFEAFVDTPLRHYIDKDENQAVAGSCHIEAEHGRNKTYVQISFPGHFPDLSGLEGNPSYVRSNFAGVVVYTTGSANGYLSYGIAADGTGFSVSMLDSDGRMANRMGLAAAVAAFVSLQLAAP